jgi:hypothetical protein
MIIYDTILMISKANFTIFLWSKCGSIYLQNFMTIWLKLKKFYSADRPNLEIAGKFARNTV